MSQDPHNLPLFSQLTFYPVDWEPDYGDDPSPEEIRKRCLEVQATWDEATERSRREWDGNKGHVTVTTCEGLFSIALEDAKDARTNFAAGGIRGVDGLGLKTGEEVPTKKLNKRKVREMRAKWDGKPASIGKLAKEYNVTRATAANVVNRVTWRNVQ